jgi:rod shape-determining protein MreD
VTSTDTARLVLRLAILAFVALVVQVALLSQLSLFGASPDLAPLVVMSVGLLAGPVAGALTGFSVGLLVDAALLQTLGVSSLVLLMIGHLAGRLRETVRDPQATLLPLAAGAIATLVALVVFSLLQFLLGVEAPVSLELFRQIVSTVLINTLIALPVHALVRRLLAPALGRAGQGPRRRRGGQGSSRSTGSGGLSPLIQP